MNISLLTPELILILFSFLVLTGGFFRLNIGFEIAIIACGASIASLIAIFIIKQPIDNSLIVSPFSSLLKILFISSLFIVILMSKDFLKGLKNQNEYCFFLLTGTIGMLLAVSSNDMVILYISIELISISSYILTCFIKDKKGIEGGIKYLLFGAFSSAFLIYGMSLLYGLTGGTNFSDISPRLLGLGFGPIPVLAIIFIFAGVCFKADIVPFHFWIPDVYQGAPTPITAFLATASKIAGFAIIMNLLFAPLGSILFDYRRLFFILSVITIILGNLQAIPQKNIKRMLGYSSISHAGYLLIGLCAYSGEGIIAMLFYFVAYSIATISSFLVISATKLEEIDDYNGFSKRSPLLSLLMLLSLSSLAGLPPLVGFFGKFSLFYSAIKQGLIPLVIIGVVFSVVSIYYYFMVIKAIYLGRKENGSISIPGYIKALAILLILSLVILGLFPNPIANLAFFANQSL
ncbi:MAG: NADH-quinone oxidoreductase subunit N [bacterium]